MDMREYQEVKGLSYGEYCDYLQKKYGIGRADYFTKNFNPNPKCKRTSEELIIHHIREDEAPMLCNKSMAQIFPPEYQQKENLVYCDYLEHLLLHILIREQKPKSALGLGGIIDFIVPELNDLYSGWATKQEWRKKCHDKAINEKELYLELIGRFYENERKVDDFDLNRICRSYNEKYGYWENEKNAALYSLMREKCNIGVS